MDCRFLYIKSIYGGSDCLEVWIKNDKIKISDIDSEYSDYINDYTFLKYILEKEMLRYNILLYSIESLYEFTKEFSSFKNIAEQMRSSRATEFLDLNKIVFKAAKNAKVLIELTMTGFKVRDIEQNKDYTVFDEVTKNRLIRHIKDSIQRYGVIYEPNTPKLLEIIKDAYGYNVDITFEQIVKDLKLDKLLNHNNLALKKLIGQQKIGYSKYNVIPDIIASIEKPDIYKEYITYTIILFSGVTIKEAAEWYKNNMKDIYDIIRDKNAEYNKGKYPLNLYKIHTVKAGKGTVTITFKLKPAIMKMEEDIRKQIEIEADNKMYKI